VEDRLRDLFSKEKGMNQKLLNLQLIDSPLVSMHVPENFTFFRSKSLYSCDYQSMSRGF
jgi:hypothetical protein